MTRSNDPGLQPNVVLAAQQIVQRTLPTLERRVDDVILGKPPFVDIDVSNVQMIDSVGLNWLLSLQARLDTVGSKLRLLDPSPIMADVLLATRLDSRFPIEVTFCRLPTMEPPATEPVAAAATGGSNGG